MRIIRCRFMVRLPFFFCAGFIIASSLFARLDTDAGRAVRRLEARAGAEVQISTSRVTGLVTFMSIPPSLDLPLKAESSHEEKAEVFLKDFGGAFGIYELDQLQLQKEQRDALTMAHLRFQQLYRGVPVTAGELSVHFREGQVSTVNAKTLGRIEQKIDMVPSIDETAAMEAARRYLARKEFDSQDVVFNEVRLEVFNRGLLDGAPYPTRLAWHLEASDLYKKERMWIDAHTGSTLLSFNALYTARDRRVYDTLSSPNLPGILVRSEGDPPTFDSDTDNAYDYSGDTYDYFFNAHGRDSFDGAGAAMVSTVHYCPNIFSCPFPNASWTGSQMLYGHGYSSADDVVAHELTHAVTDHSADLFYYMQSGALNESYSDIFGETVDLLNGAGSDGPIDRWYVGEDLPNGPIRDMWFPNLFDDPETLSDPLFFCDAEADGGGVHSNSGVPNRAYVLMVDGGFHNGVSVDGIGLSKAAQIQYRALNHYLLSASDFLDNYNAIQQSCNDLVGTSGITPADCVEVVKAMDAVEMSEPWPCTIAHSWVPELCYPGEAVIDFFYDDLEDGGGHWEIYTPIGESSWSLQNAFATSGTRHLYSQDPDMLTDSSVELDFDIPLPSGSGKFRLQFQHAFDFENNGTTLYDGGVVEYSLNGGVTWMDALPLFHAGAFYEGILSSCCSNPIAGRWAFAGDSYGYVTTQFDLSSLAGQSVRLRFRVGADEAVGDFGWFIDDVRVYECNATIFEDGFESGNTGAWSSTAGFRP